MSTSYFKSEARRALEGKWQTFSLCVLIYVAINAALSAPSLISDISDLWQLYHMDELLYEPSFSSDLTDFLINSLLSLINLLVSIFVTYHLYFAMSAIALKVIKNEEIQVSDIFVGFHNYSNVLILTLLENLYVFLWCLLFIIPGFIKAIGYSMAKFIMAENPDIRPSDAIKESEELMDGYKFDYFVLQLSFLGWILLSIITLDISALYSQPYLFTAKAIFYYTIKKEKYGDAIPYGESDEMYLQYPYDYVTNQPTQEHEARYNYEPQTVEPTYTYLGNMNTSTPSQEESLTEAEASEETP